MTACYARGWLCSLDGCVRMIFGGGDIDTCSGPYVTAYYCCFIYQRPMYRTVPQVTNTEGKCRRDISDSRNIWTP